MRQISPNLGPVYLTLYMVLAYFVGLNVFIAIVNEGYHAARNIEAWEGAQWNAPMQAT